LRAGQLADAPKSGGVFAQALKIRGLPEVRFAG
jgi:L-arabinonolactonase